MKSLVYRLAARSCGARHRACVRAAPGRLAVAQRAAAGVRLPARRARLPRRLHPRRLAVDGAAREVQLALASRRRSMTPAAVVVAYLAAVPGLGLLLRPSPRRCSEPD